MVAGHNQPVQGDQNGTSYNCTFSNSGLSRCNGYHKRTVLIMTNSKSVSTKKETQISESKSNIVDVHVLASAPASGSREMLCYTIAMFTVLGAYTRARKAFAKSNIVGKFYASDAIFRAHLPKGNIEKTKTRGMFRITAQGLKFFEGRRNMKIGGRITDEEIAGAVSFIVTGKTKDTVFAGLQTSKAVINL